jgi:stress-induced morphogen
MAVTPEQIKSKLTDGDLQATHVVATDMSDGCGAKFDVVVVSEAFEGECHAMTCPSCISLNPCHRQ